MWCKLQTKSPTRGRAFLEGRDVNAISYLGFFPLLLPPPPPPFAGM
jgi:hypothetical protein